MSNRIAVTLNAVAFTGHVSMIAAISGRKSCHTSAGLGENVLKQCSLHPSRGVIKLLETRLVVRLRKLPHDPPLGFSTKVGRGKHIIQDNSFGVRRCYDPRSTAPAALFTLFGPALGRIRSSHRKDSRCFVRYTRKV